MIPLWCIVILATLAYLICGILIVSLICAIDIGKGYNLKGEEPLAACGAFIWPLLLVVLAFLGIGKLITWIARLLATGKKKVI